MASVGERLRDEREARNATIEEISAATGIELDYLVALENNDYQSFPGRAFGKFFIRAYGKTLRFDPQPLIDQYDRERGPAGSGSTEESLDLPAQPPQPPQPRRVEAEIARWRQATMAERHKKDARIADEVVAAPVEVEIPHERLEPAVSRSRRPLAFALVFIGLFLAAAGAYFSLFRTNLEGSEPLIPDPPVRLAQIPHEAPVVPPIAASPVVTRRAASAVPVDSVPPSALTVPEFSVGRRIVDRRLTDQTDRFARGEVAWFSTRLLGARRGESIRHVWFHDGRAVQSIPLRVGGPDWRTHSRKTLRETGEWAVEARDRKGRVLARATFACLPAGS